MPNRKKEKQKNQSWTASSPIAIEYTHFFHYVPKNDKLPNGQTVSFSLRNSILYIRLCRCHEIRASGNAPINVKTTF